MDFTVLWRRVCAAVNQFRKLFRHQGIGGMNPSQPPASSSLLDDPFIANSANMGDSIKTLPIKGANWGPLVFGAITGGTQTQHWRGGGHALDPPQVPTSAESLKSLSKRVL
jgi:hypothetical protein